MRAVGIGTLSLDVTRHPGGEMQRAGGSCANILMHLADMGWNCTMCHMTGNNDAAKYVKDDLNARGVKSVTMGADVPAYVIIINSDNGHTFGRTCTHGNKTPSRIFVDESLLNELFPTCDAFVFDRPEVAAAKFAVGFGGLKWFETYEHTQHGSMWDMCVELADITKTADGAIIPGHKAQMHTRGSDGLEYFGPDERITVPAISDRAEARWSSWRSAPHRKITMPAITPPRFADACGCGDCVSACCIDSWCNGDTIWNGLARGTRLAALNCCYPGPWCMMDSTTKQYRKNVMNGEPIRDPPRSVFKGKNFEFCTCET